MSADELCHGDTKRRKTIEDGDADLEFGGLTIEIAGSNT